MINLFSFIDRALQTGFNINLDKHHLYHVDSKLNFEPNFAELGSEFRSINKILKEIVSIYDKLKNQFKFKYHPYFSASFS